MPVAYIRSCHGGVPGGGPGLGADDPVHAEPLLGLELAADLLGLAAVLVIDGDAPAAAGHLTLPGAGAVAGCVVDQQRPGVGRGLPGRGRRGRAAAAAAAAALAAGRLEYPVPGEAGPGVVVAAASGAQVDVAAYAPARALGLAGREFLDGNVVIAGGLA